MTQKYQVLARRYRPQKFKDVVGQEAVVTTLKNALKFEKIGSAYLFSGSRGIGKTTLARLFAKTLNCQNLTEELEPCNDCPSCIDISNGQSLDVIEIDGASNRGIDDIRQINETVAYAPSKGRYKIYIIDEVHMLTKEAFNALLKTLEEPPERAKFFFATTEPHKVLPTIISRCQRFDLGRLKLSEIIAKLEEISKDLSRSVEMDALHLIASFSEGSLRDAESLFDQILCFSENLVSAKVVRDALGLIPHDEFFKLDRAFFEGNIPFAFELVERLYQSGKDLSHFLSELIEHYRSLTLYKAIGQEALHTSLEMLSKYQESTKLYTEPQLLYILEYLLQIETQFSKSSFPRITLESILLHLIRSKNRVPVEVLVKRLSELEEALGKEEEASPVLEKASAEIPSTPNMGENPSANFQQDLSQEPLKAKEGEAPKAFEQTANTANSQQDLSQTELKAKTEKVPVEKKPLEEKLEKIPFNPFDSVEKPPVLEKERAPSLNKHPSHYDTLMRFTSVELEGTFTPKK